MSGCLTDMQIALLVAGKASPALRRVLGEHLLACEACRRLVAACVKAERLDPLVGAEEADAGPITVGNAPPRIRRVVEIAAGAKRPTVSSGTIRQVVPLEWLVADRPAEAAVLAAAPQIDQVAGLPTLVSADRQVLVHFRRPDPGGSIVAYVIRRGEPGTGGTQLVLPERGLSFPVGPQGTAELSGVEARDLVGVKVQLEMTPLNP